MRKSLVNSLKNKNCKIIYLFSQIENFNFLDNFTILNNIEKEHEKCLNLCESEMDIANACYYFLDNNIKRVNQLIENMEQELVATKFNDFSYQNSLLDKNFDELLNFENYLNNKKKSKNKKSRNALKNLNLNLNISINSLKKRKSKKKVGVKLGRKANLKKKEIQTKKDNSKLLLNLNNNNLEDITFKEIDGKIGIREPIYCFCNYVSYGDMVKCDNVKCPREWFHFHCVGLRNFPKGKWYCSAQCAKQNMKKK